MPEGDVMTTRRQFVFAVIPAAALLPGAARTALAQGTRVEEKDPLALSLGYVHDAAKVDAKKFPTYAAGRNCSNCQLFQAKAGEAWGGCPPLGGKLVNAKGWCQVWVKKA